MQLSLRRQSGASQLTCAKKKRKNEMWLASETGTSVWEPSWLDSNDRERACLEGSLFSDRVSVPNTEPGVRLHELTLGHSLVFLKRPAGKVTHTIETVISCSPPSHAQVRLCGRCTCERHTGRGFSVSSPRLPFTKAPDGNMNPALRISTLHVSHSWMVIWVTSGQ